MRYFHQLLLLDGFGVLGQRKLLSSLVLFVGAGGIGSTLLLFLSLSDVERTTAVEHHDVEVFNLHQQVIHTEGRRGTSKARSACDAMRALNPTVLVMVVMEHLIWEKYMEIVRGNECVVDARNNPCMLYLVKDTCIMAGREPKTAEMTNGVSGTEGGPIPLVSGSAMGTEGKLTIS